MADTVNQQLVDAAVERDKHLQAKATAVILAAIALLDSSEPELRVLLERYLALLTRPGIDLSSPVIQGQINQMRLDISSLRGRYIGYVNDNLSEGASELITDEWKFLAATYEATAGIALIVPGGGTIQEILDTPYLGRPFGTWMDDLATSDANRIADAVITGVIQNRSRQQILEAALGEQDFDGANGATQISRNNLKSIIDTGIISWTAQAQVDMLDVDLFPDNAAALPRELYVAVLDGRTTQICRSLNGQVFPVGNGPIPPLHWYCRSRRVPLPPEGAVPNVK